MHIEKLHILMTKEKHKDSKSRGKTALQETTLFWIKTFVLKGFKVLFIYFCLKLYHIGNIGVISSIIFYI